MRRVVVKRRSPTWRVRMVEGWGDAPFSAVGGGGSVSGCGTGSGSCVAEAWVETKMLVEKQSVLQW